MYGLVVESLVEYIRSEYSEEAWEEIRQMSGLPFQAFSTTQIFSESTIPTIINNACKLLNVSERDIMESVGKSFIMFVGRYGYDRILSVLGRHMRDFLNGLDNLHEYLRFSYPRMRPPSFFCEGENRNGLKLHYRTKRRGFIYYTMGQIKAVGKHYYNTNVDIDIILEEMQLNTLHVIFQLHFDNTGFEDDQIVIIRDDQFLPIQAHVFLDIFPFSIFFDSTLRISFLGSSLHTIMSKVIGKKIVDVFSLIRPLIDFGWVSILSRMNNIFELVALEPTLVEESDDVIPFNPNEDTDREIKETKCLKLKGQMLYMEEWNGILYLGTPVMPDLETMIETGLYINDLSMHDFSRDLMLAGTQQSVELKLALDQEHQKSKRLEESMRKLDEEMKRTDELLYQMIPKAVADRLRKGETAVNTCEVFDSVTILFSDIVTFTEICSRITPMEVVSLLNAMYSLFDRLTEIHNVYKVETIGDAYMVVGGAPDRSHIHAQQVANMALDMLNIITGLKDPSTNDSIRIRVGMHSGTVVAGVVGVKMPRYCLFGDAVNTASRMESSGQAMKIQVSPQTKALLPPDVYYFSERGVITVKGKGEVTTFWLTGKAKYEPPKIGTTEGTNTEASSYSPLIVGDKILKRNSIAYNALSPLTTPNASRPTTAEVGRKAVPKSGEEVTSFASQGSTVPIQPNDGIASQIPIIREPNSKNNDETKEISFVNETLQTSENKDRQNISDRRISLAKRGNNRSELLNPTLNSNSMPLGKSNVPSSNVQPQERVLTYQPIVMNVPPMSQGNNAIAIGDKVANTKPPSPTGFTNNITGTLLPDTTTRMQIEKLETSQRSYPQQVVPHVHCSLQCQSTTCELQ